MFQLKIFSFCVLGMLSLFGKAQVTLYSENFSGQNGKGAIGSASSITIDTSNVTWSVDTSDVNFQNTSDYIEVVSEKMEFRDTEGNAKWTSSYIDISNLTSLTLSIDLSEVGTMESSDTISVYYKIDNGSETLVKLINDDFTSYGLTDTSLAGTGDTLYIMVYAKNNADAEKHRIDNLIVKGTCGSTPSESSDFSATAGVNKMNLSWTSPTCSDEILIVAKDSSSISGTPSGNGSAYTADSSYTGSGTAFDSGKVIYKGSGNSVEVLNLTAATTYYFKIWSRTGSNWTSGIEISSAALYIPNLIISEIIDPSDSLNARYIEVFNTDSIKIDFSETEFQLCKETNGSGSFSCRALSGTLAPGETYVIASNATTYSNSYSKTADDSYGSFSINGDDGVFLYVNGDNTTGTLWDSYGVIGEDGTGKSWEYQDKKAVRDSNHYKPNATWTASEWTISSSTTAGATPSSHTSAYPFVTLNASSDLVAGVYRTLVINGTAITVTATGNVFVINKLKLKNGLLNLNSNKLFLGNFFNDCLVSDASSSSYIYGGTVRYYVNSNTGTYKFEIGTSTNYTRAEITFTSATLSSISYLDASVDNTAHPNLPSHVVNYIKRHWTIESSGITNPNYEIDLVYADADMVGTESSYLPVKYASGSWTAPGNVANNNVDTVGTGSVNTGTNTLNWTGVNGFSIFTGVGDGSPLPVELIYFNGTPTSKGNELTWATASEVNSDYFEIEKRVGENGFIALDRIISTGNSNELISYNFMDLYVNSDLNFYRLKQVDFNGESNYSKIIKINSDEIIKENIEFFVSDGNVSIFHLPNEDVEIQVLSITGEVIYSDNSENKNSAIIPLMGWKPGIYLLSVSANGIGLLTEKIIRSN